MKLQAIIHQEDTTKTPDFYAFAKATYGQAFLDLPQAEQYALLKKMSKEYDRNLVNIQH